MQQDMGRNKIKNIGDTVQLLQSMDLCIMRQVQEERSDCHVKKWRPVVMSQLRAIH